ncbi:MAG: nucleotidyltransferase [Phycisphaerales bacterium]|nr:nucleotidyltransferase [Phycisphaerales bacterium]
MDLPLPPDFKEFLRLLDSEKIEYLLVGGYAVAFYGYPRPTGDLDVWIATSPRNATRMVDALSKFGFAGAGATTELFQTADRVIRMGVPPVRIEVLTSISGVRFDECFDRRNIATIDGVSVSVISRQDLLTNKRAAARDKDLADLAQLESDNA